MAKSRRFEPGCIDGIGLTKDGEVGGDPLLLNRFNEEEDCGEGD